MKPEYTTVKVSEIELGERRRTDYGDIDKLAAGINRVGLLQPLIVQQVNGHFKVVAGGRRFKAIQRLGWQSRWESQHEQRQSGRIPRLRSR